MGQGALVDTSILIPLYNEGRYEEDFLELNRTTLVLFSTVSINEFLRGAHDKTSRQIVDSFLEIVRDQLITPTEEHWVECGYTAERLLKGKRRSKEAVVLLQNDILISLASRDSGAMLMTNDKKDFQLIEKYIKVSVDYWS